MPKMTDRADAFAKRVVKRPPEDPRSTEEKLVDFAKDYDPMKAMKKARQNARRARG